MDSDTGLATFKNKPMGTVTFKIGGVNYPLTPSQYLIPSQQYNDWGLPPGINAKIGPLVISSSNGVALCLGSYYSWIPNGGVSASDVNFIIGQKFLENYVSYYFL